jgi:hypothetical protein
MTQDGLFQNLSEAMVGASCGDVQTVNALPVERAMRETGLDETLADTFPCSDALSSIPDPCDLSDIIGLSL